MNAVTIVLLCIVLINVCLFRSICADTCTELVETNTETLPGFDDDEPVDALELSVKCGGSYAELEWITKKNTVSLLQLEYSCYNLTSGRRYFGVIIELADKKTGAANITKLEDMHCTFSGCVESVDPTFSVEIWKMNLHSVNCSNKDEDSTVVSSVSSSSITRTISPSPFLVRSSTFLINISSSFSNHDQMGTQSSPVQSTSPSSLVDQNLNDPFSTLGSGGITVSTVLPILVVFLSTAVLAVLIVVCLSYRRWIKKTTSVHYEYEVKQELSDQVRSVSYYSIDDISTTGSAITVLRSLTIKHSYEESEKEEDISKPIKIEHLNLSNDKYKEDDEFDTTSDCLTVVLHSPTSQNGVLSSSSSITNDNLKQFLPPHKSDPVFDVNVNVTLPPTLQPVTTQANSDGYLQENSQLETLSTGSNGYSTYPTTVPFDKPMQSKLSGNVEQSASLGDYISGDAPPTDEDDVIGQSRIPAVPSHLLLLESTSDYMSGASSCSVTNSDYLPSPSSEVFTPTEPQQAPYMTYSLLQRNQEISQIPVSDSAIDLCGDNSELNSEHHSSLLHEPQIQSVSVTSSQGDLSNGYIANEPIEGVYEEFDNGTPIVDDYIDSCSHTEELIDADGYSSSTYLKQAVLKPDHVFSRIPGNESLQADDQYSHETCDEPKRFRTEDFQIDLCELDYQYNTVLEVSSSTSQPNTQSTDYLSSPSFTKSPNVKTVTQLSHDSQCPDQAKVKDSRMDVAACKTACMHEDRSVLITSLGNNTNGMQCSDLTVDLTPANKGGHQQFLHGQHNCFDMGYFISHANHSSVKSPLEEITTSSSSAVNGDYTLAKTPSQDRC